MAKDPAFLFYPGDYIAGTMHLDFICKGAYVDILMLQFNRGHMTLHMIQRMLGDDFGQVWGQIQDKFLIELENGVSYYYNERLRIEKAKRQKYVESRLNNKNGTNQYNKSSKKTKGHMTKHMEDENENENIIKDVYKNIFDKLNSEIKLDDNFKELILQWLKYKSEKNQSYKETGMKTLINGILKDSDNNFERAKEMIEYSMKNNYAGIFKQNTDKKITNKRIGHDTDF